MDVDYTEFRDLEEAIQALTERVDKLEDRLANHFHPEPWTPKPDVLGDPEIKVAMEEWKAAKPIPGLNDGKADTEKLVQKYIDRCVDENIIYMEHIDRHKVLMRQLIAESQAQEWLNARKLPFDTGLSVLDSLKK